jgi:hypothetical protein
MKQDQNSTIIDIASNIILPKFFNVAKMDKLEVYGNQVRNYKRL